MKRLLVLALCLLFLLPGHALAAIDLSDAEGAAYAEGALIAPGTALEATIALPAGQGQALRLQLTGLALEGCSFAPETGEAPEIVYGSDGCILLFSGEASGTLRFTASAGAVGEAKIALLAEGAPIENASYTIGLPATPSPVPAEPVAAEPPEETEGANPAVFIALLAACLAAGLAVLHQKRYDK